MFRFNFHEDVVSHPVVTIAPRLFELPDFSANTTDFKSFVFEPVSISKDVVLKKRIFSQEQDMQQSTFREIIKNSGTI